MPISVSEQTAVTCPACGQPFTAEAWVLVDATERPELAQALRDGTLDRATCPHCGATSAAGTALLFHEPAQRRVSFAVPAHIAEHAWRERAQELLQKLLGSIPAEAQLPYLGDVQVEQEVEGLRRAVLRRDKKNRARPASAASGQSAVDMVRAQLEQRTENQEPRTKNQEPRTENREPRTANPQSLVASPQPSTDELLDAIQELLAADTGAQFRAVVAARPLLLGEGADALLAELANAAYNEGDRSLAEALHTARSSLRALSRIAVGTLEAEPLALPAPQSAAHMALGGEASYAALLRATTSAELVQVLADYPTLLDPQSDAELVARAEQALEEGNERLARQIEERREALIELRAVSPDGSPVMQAIEALLIAEDEAAKVRVIADYPVLLTDAAQQSLSSLAASARTQGDTTLAEYAAECQAMLHLLRSQ